MFRPTVNNKLHSVLLYVNKYRCNTNSNNICRYTSFSLSSSLFLNCNVSVKRSVPFDKNKNLHSNIYLLRSSIHRAMSVKVRVDEVVISHEDKREYRGLVLQNDLKVMLISDPTTDKSGASLDVHIGCMSDPRSLPGLAHYCEHMLFMGTEKYNSENEYSKYLSENGGASNAYTGLDHTNYYFDVSPDALPGALDRFSQFFVCPLFTESMLEREVNAVNSEHEKNIQNDYWRLLQIERSTSNPDHDFNKFGTGNKETLCNIPKGKGINVRDELLKFHRQWYSANIMGLCILGKESLDELESSVVDLFSCIKNYGVEVPSWPSHPFGKSECEKQFSIVPVKDIRNLAISFPIPDLQEHYKSCPATYLAELIGHEGCGSLLSYLKGHGWVSQLSGGCKAGAKGFGFFVVNVDLTEEGFEHTDDIILSIFQYFNLLRVEGPKKWFFDECKSLREISFRFKDKERPISYVASLSENLHHYPLSETLWGPYAYTTFDTDLITSVLSMLRPNNVRVTVLGKGNKEKVDCKEAWYGAEYCMKDIPRERLHCWDDCGSNAELRLPTENSFIPTDFCLQEPMEPVTEFPALVCKNDLCKIWYKLDTEFKLPKSTLFTEFFSPLAYMDPHHSNMIYMFVQLFRDSLTEYSYSATLAGLHYDLRNTKFGLTLNILGFKDKQHTLLEMIIDRLTSLTIDKQRFNILKDNYVRNLRNFSCEQPHQHLVYYTSLILSEQAWGNDDLLSVIDKLTVENLEEFIPKFLSSLHIEALVHGSLSLTKAEEMCGIIMSQLGTKCKTRALLPQQHRRFREGIIDEGRSYIYQAETKVHSSSAVELFLQFGMMSTHTNMLAELLVQIIHEPSFDQLRTKEQLGYIVWCGLRRANGVQGLRVIIQGERDPTYLDERIEQFLHKMETYIADLSPSDFDKHMSALAKQRLERAKQLSQLSHRWWSEIISNHLNFNRDQVEVEHLRTITKEQLMEFYKKYVSHSSSQRRKFAVHVLSTAEGGAGNPETVASTESVDGPEEELNLQKAELIDSISTFKASLGLYPLTKPSVPLSSLLAKDSKAKL